MKQTAIEQAIELIKKDYEVNGRLRPAYVFQTLEQAKAMEKEQIVEAWDDAYEKGTRDRIEKISNPVGDANQYYNETFKSE